MDRVSDLKAAANAVKKEAPLLNLNLTPFYTYGLFLLLLATPFMRGLFFLPELLAAMILAGICFIFACWDQALSKDTAVFKAGMDYAAAAFILAYGASLITAVHPGEAVRSLLVAATLVMAYYAAGRAAGDGKRIDVLLNIMYLSAVGVALIGAGAALGWLHYPGAYSDGIIMSTLQYKNALAIYLTIFNIAGLALSARPEKVLYKVLYAAGNFIIITVILCTQSRGGWLLYPAGVAMLVWGLPQAFRWRVVYHFLIFAGPGLFVIRKFLPLVSEGNGAKAAWFFAAGLAATVALQVGYHYLAAFLNQRKIEDKWKSLIAYSGVGYLVLVAAVYVIYASSSLSLSAGGVLPGQIVSRAESIANQDTTLPDRFKMTFDAVKIGRDHPLTGAGGGGWNALYHRYQSSLYYSSEVHNHFAQTWVEAGIPGIIALLMLWVFFARMAVVLWKRQPKDEGWISLWSVITAASVLGVHSAFDFDLSLPAIGIVLWVMFGMVREAYAGVQNPEKVHARDARVLDIKKAAFLALCGTVIGLLVIIPSVSFYRAGLYAALGAKKMIALDYENALAYLSTAHRLNPLMGNYMGDMAQCSAALAVGKNDAVKHYQAMDWAKRASEAEPYNYKLRFSMANVYLLLGEFDRAASEAEGVAAANPNAGQSYELLGQAGILAARYHMERNRDDRAREYIERVKSLPGIIQERRKTLKYSGSMLGVAPGLEFSLAQAAFLEGNYGRAAAGMKRIKLTEREDVLKAWLAAALYKAGSRQEAEGLLNSISGKNDLVKLYNNLINSRRL